jgi:NADH/F420H2 dehydrogenase subunit C
MISTELKEQLSILHPSLVIEEPAEWLHVHVEASEWLVLAGQLKNNESLSFDYLFCVTCVDWKTHLSMVYHLRSLKHAHTLVVKIKLDREKPEVESVANIWRTAEFHEREAYDLFGVIFLHHPDLRRLFLTEDWVGWPLRKDYEDPVNMIKL